MGGRPHAALRRDAHPRAAGCAWPAPRAPRRDRIEDRGTGAHALTPGTAARHRPAPAAPAGEFGTSGGHRHLFHSFTQSTNVCGRLGCARRVTCRARRSPGKHLHSSVTETLPTVTATRSTVKPERFGHSGGEQARGKEMDGRRAPGHSAGPRGVRERDGHPRHSSRQSTGQA